ncbi:MAG: C25 family cysteine peptidase [bacterium]|nr:C25 family cysteine peptidase [bacterium]
MNKLLSLLGILSLSLSLFGGELTETVRFSKTDLIFSKFNEYDVIKLKDAVYTTEVGNPLLPCYQVRILIPSTATATRLDAILFDKEKLYGKYTICPTQPPRPVSIKEEIPFVQPNPEVYSSHSPYPGKLAELVGTESKGGYRIAEILIYPVQYIPAERSLIFYSSIVLRLNYENRHPISEITEFQKEAMERTIRGLVINPEVINMYAPLVKDKQNEIRYCIITSSDFAYEFQRLADWKTKKGIKTKVVALDSIYANYPGIDNPTKIRNFIRDAYDNLGTQYFLLGGQCDFENGQEVVPRRDVYCTYEPPDVFPDCDTVPCDMYYSALDGTWDGNGNGTYGEMDDGVDLYSDVFVGRAPVMNLTQAQTFVDKVLTYERNPPMGYQKKILLPAAHLFTLVDYWGDVVNNAIAEVTPPGGWGIAKLYESNGTLSRQRVRDSLNAGFAFVHYAAHGRPNGLCWMNGETFFDSDDVDGLHNGDKLGIHNAISCAPGAVDWVPGGDCFAEHLMNNPNGGSIACIMNTRLGLGAVPELGPSELMDLEFYKKLFNEDLYHIGEAHNASREEYATATQPVSEVLWRYCIYELTLFGDPELPVWTDEPKNLTVNYQPIIYIGPSKFEVACSYNNSPVSNAVVCLMKENELYEIGTTDLLGRVIFSITPTTTGTLYVTVTTHNFLPYEGYTIISSPVSVVIEPDTIKVTNPTPISITLRDTLNQSVPNVVVRISGLGVSELDTTNTVGQCIINVNPPYGEILRCYGYKIGENWNLFWDSIWVTGATEFTSPNLSTQVPEIGLVDVLTPYYEGIITGSCENSGFTIFAKGCGVDTSATTIGTAGNLGVTPTNWGTLWSYIAKTGYKVYKEAFSVIKIFGKLVGTVKYNNNPIPGVIIKGYRAGIDTAAVYPIFIDTSDASGWYSSRDSISVDKYDIYAVRFGYLPYFATHIVKHGIDTFDIQLQPAPYALLYGTVTDSMTGTSLSANIEIYRVDNMELYTTAYTEPATGVYEVALPYFTYKLHVVSPHYSIIYRNVTIDSDSLELNFLMCKTNVNILVINDDLAKAGESATRIATLFTKFGYDVTQEQSSATSPSTWADYNFIVWSAGDAAGALTNSVLRDSLKSHVQTGRKLLIEGGEIGYLMLDFDSNFARTVLHVDSWYGDTAGPLVAQNLSHSIVTTPNNLPYTIPISYSNWGDADVLRPLEDATIIYGTRKYNRAVGILAYEPTPQVGQIVFYAFNLMAIDSSVGAQLLENTAHYLVPQVGIELIEKLPKFFDLYPPYPNPFGKRTVIKYQIPGTKSLGLGVRPQIKIYDLTGRLVKLFPLITNHLSTGFCEPLTTAVSWDGCDSSGERVASGVYFCTLEAEQFRRTRKIILLR